MKNLRYAVNFIRYFLRYSLTKKPQQANYDITWQCNLNCEHCYWKKYSYGKKELTDEEWEKAFKEHRKKGLICAALTGGEPSLRQNILSTANNVFDSIYIISNGTRKISENINRRIFVSLDGNRETHNGIRGANIFDKVIQNIKNDKRVVITSTLSKTNLGQIEEIVRIARDANVFGITFSLYTADSPNSNLLLKGNDLDYAISTLKKVKKENPDFVFLSSKMIDAFKTKEHIKNCFLRSKFVISYYPDLSVKTPCVLGQNIDCSTCGCIVPIYIHCIRKLDIESAKVISRMFNV